MDEPNEIWPPPPTTPVPTPVLRPVAAWERVCGGVSILCAMIGTISLGIAISEGYVAHMAGGLWTASQRNADIMILSTIIGIILELISLAAGTAGRRSWQGRSGLLVALIGIGLGVVAIFVQNLT